MRRAVLAALGVVSAAALVVAALAGDAGFSTALYLRVVDHTPSRAVSLTADVGLLALVALYSASALRHRRAPARLSKVVAGGAGVAAAYVLNERLKVAFAADRPCRVVLQLAECPATGDWSFPSNHAVIAFALLTCLITARSRMWFAAVLLATAVGYARVAVGVHYPHDVVAGAVVGVAGASAAMLLCSSRVRAVLERRTTPITDGSGATSRRPVEPRRRWGR